MVVGYELFRASCTGFFYSSGTEFFRGSSTGYTAPAAEWRGRFCCRGSSCEVFFLFYEEEDSWVSNSGFVSLILFCFFLLYSLASFLIDFQAFILPRPLVDFFSSLCCATKY